MKEIEKGVAYLRKSDPVIKRLIDKYGTCLLKPSENYFQDLVSTIISQQLSMKAYLTIEKRLYDRLKNKVTPDRILSLPDEDFRSCGLSGSKTKYIKNVAEFSKEKPWFFKNLNKLTDDEITVELLSIKGIGYWSVQMFLIFNLCRLDVFPINDGGIRRTMQNLYKIKGENADSRLLKIADKWGKYKTIATWYLWRSLDNK
jgi:DNA-3-methyladenine glycosylase II